jgi:N-acetylneuraminic acid mutarotase
VSITEVYEIAPSVQQSAKMPTRAHDAAAGFLGHDLYVFGGGQATSTDTVFRLAHGVATLAGRLSSPLSDAVCVPYRWHGIDGLLLIGGYDDKHYRQTIDFVSLAGDTLRYQPVARIPVGLRYTAAATDGRAVYLAGGRTPSGLSREVYEVRPDTGEVRAVAALPEELQKCAAFWVDSRLIVVGGLTASGTPTADVLAVDPRTAAVQRIGRLPVPLADMGYAQQGAIAYLAGGKTRASDASVTGAIWKLRFTH